LAFWFEIAYSHPFLGLRYNSPNVVTYLYGT